MSFKAFVWAWGQPLGKDEHLIVLLALADIANEGGLVRASVPFIATKCRKSERTVRRALVAMDGAQITITERPGKVDLIQINLPEEFMVKAPRDQEQEAGRRGRPRKTLATMPKTPGADDGKPVSQVAYEPKTEPEEEPKKGVLSPRDPFDEWWAHYPRKVAKAAAVKPFWLAMTKQGCNTPLQALIEAADRFAEEVKVSPIDKIPHPATWLNGERWNDEPEGNRSQVHDSRFHPANVDRVAHRDATVLSPMLAGAQQALLARGRQGSDAPYFDQSDPAPGVRGYLPGPGSGEDPGDVV